MPLPGRAILFLALSLLLTTTYSAWTGVMGLTFDSNRPIESKSLHCPSGFLTGIRVKYGRTRQEDRDLYDFKLKCGTRWTSWSGLWFKNEVEDKTMECPSKMYVTGIEVKRGRNDWTDRDTYDFKLQCSGVWQSYIGMRSSKEQEIAAAECPSGEGTSGIKVYRGFVEWGDKDLYEYELNCKSIAQNLASIRGLPDLKMLGLPRNVLTWDAEQLGTWLDALGLGELVAAFQAHNVDGGTVFLLTEDHLKELGFNLVGDRLYFVEVLTQLYDDIVNWSAALGIQLATHPVPPLRKLGLSQNPTSWTVKDVCKVLKAVNLGEYACHARTATTTLSLHPSCLRSLFCSHTPLITSLTYNRYMELFVEHRIQGDVLFSLTEENLREMGVGKVGDRLLITDITQTLYEQITGWQQQTVKQNSPQLLQLGGGGA